MSANRISWEQFLFMKANEALECWEESGMKMSGSPCPESAYEYCTEITYQHSRTFFLASSLLPTRQKRAVRALYAFCRISDDLVDRSNTDQQIRWQQWQQRSLSDQPSSDDPVAQAWADTRWRYRIPQCYAEQLLDGVAQDLNTSRYQSFDELTRYCYGVASTVGLMAMHVVGYSGPEAIPYAIKLGVALQLTNILRDVAEDWANSRLYLPLEELAAFGLSEAEIAAGCAPGNGLHFARDQRWQAFMRFQIGRTRRLYAEALPGIALLGRQGRLAIAVAAELYRAILTDIEKRDYDVFSRRAYLTTGQKLRLLPGVWWRVNSKGYRRRAPKVVPADPVSSPIGQEFVI